MNYLLNIYNTLHRTERRALILLSAGDVLTSLLDIGSLALLVWMLNGYLGWQRTAAPLWATPIVQGHWWPALLLLLLFALKNYWAYRLSVIQYRYIYKVSLRLSEDQLNRYLSMSYPEYVQTDSATHIQEIKHQPIAFAQYELRGLQQILAQTLLIGITISVLVWYQPLLFLLLTGLLIPVCGGLALALRSSLRKARRLVKETGHKALQHLQEAIGAYVEINMYGKAGFFTKRYLRQERAFTGLLSRQQSIQGLPSRFMEVCALGGLVILLFLHERLHLEGSISLFTIGAFMGAAYKIIPGLVTIFNSAALLKTYAFTAGDRGAPATREAAALQEEGTAHVPFDEAFPEPLRSIHFDNVSFQYDQTKIIEGLYLHLEPGDCIALQGISGKGKTTLAHLLLGFLEPTSGIIFFNDVPTDANTRKRFWSRMSYMQQKPFLFNDTILNNITLEESTSNKARLRAAAKAAGLTGPGGGTLDLQRVIKENGATLSGGQRQRIAFARALYKEADILILDEPFSELDHKMEQRMLQQIQRLGAEGKMVILITHHLSHAPYCNKTLSLDEA